MALPIDSAQTLIPPPAYQAKLDQLAVELYTLAAMLVGEGESSAQLAVTAVETSEVSACENPIAARKSARRALCRAALAQIAAANPATLAAPAATATVQSCIADDDLEAAGVSAEELQAMLSGPERDRVRTWLEQLSTPVRTVFVLRAVAGYCPIDTAAMLAEFGGPQAAGWTPKAASDVFRQGLCSLASQLLHASTTRA
ncbi:hypothetical protein ACOBR2_06785 [Telmatobacter bradus]|uniref:hypothetical protein n=1 Tax=Telmatobacter bradus TaxID=474953 RepID=UPI003B42D0CE